MRSLPFLTIAFAFGLKKTEEEQSSEPLTAEEQAERAEKELVAVIKEAKVAELKNNFDDADELFHRALGTLNTYGQRKIWEEPRILQARLYIYDCQANMALAGRQFEKAEKLFKEVMKGMLQQGISQEDNAMVEISLKLAIIFASLDRFKDAETGYKFCIDVQRKKLKASREPSDITEDDHALLGLTLDAYARFLLVQKRLSEAKACFVEALDVAKVVVGDSHAQVAVVLNNLASVEVLLKDMESAKIHEQEAVRIARVSESNELASYLCNLGAIHMGLTELKAAKAQCEKALTLAVVNQDENLKKRAKFCIDKASKLEKEAK